MSGKPRTAGKRGSAVKPARGAAESGRNVCATAAEMPGTREMAPAAGVANRTVAATHGMAPTTAAVAASTATAAMLGQR
jgi:hypothetical protein